MRRHLLAVLFAALLCLPLGAANAATVIDPALRWHTIETPHFRVNFSEGQEAIAQKAARLAEDAHAKLVPLMKTVPSQRTELTLLDHEDTVNGFALPYPNNAMYVYLTPPNDEHLWGRYDDWLKLVIIHEYTHVLQFETVSGWPSWINRVFGRVLYPNFFQPFFLVEGLAVTTETMHTTGGRAQEGEFDVFLRTASLEDKLDTIDRAGGYYLNDWPRGSSTYIYGTYFYKYLIEQHGQDAPAAIAHTYSENFGLGINHAIKKVTGKDAYQLWDELHTYLKARAATQLAQIKRKPLSDSVAVTTSGRYHRHPGWTPEGELLFIESTGHRPGGIYQRPKEGEARRLFGKSPYGAYSLGGRYVYYHSSHEVDRFYDRQDLYRFDRQDRTIKQLTHGQRVTDPAVSPDGKQVVAVLNDKGQTQLVLFDAEGNLVRQLTQDEDTTYSAPVWHPSGRYMVLSVWRNGSRDLYRYDLASPPQPLWKDAAIDINPTFSPDGKYLVFSSDRTGVFNVYAHRLADGKQFQVTNVIGAAIEPAVSPDGKTLAISSYSAQGWDIHTADFDPERWPADRATQVFAFDGSLMPAPEPKAFSEASTETYPVRAYNPWPSLSPKAWGPVAFSDERGAAVGVGTFGSDVLLQHSMSVNAGYGLQSQRPFYGISYNNDQFYPTLSLSLMDFPDSTTGIAQSANGDLLLMNFWQRQMAGVARVTFPGLPPLALGNRWVTGQNVTIGYAWQTTQDLGLSMSSLTQPSAGAFVEPEQYQSLQGKPFQGQTNSAFVSYSFGDNYRSPYAISPESGSLVNLTYEKAGDWFGGQRLYDNITGDYRVYSSLPWAHHVLALRAAAGYSFGGGNFFMGGADSAFPFTFNDLRAISSFRAVPLRGYRAASLRGDHLGMASLEYRFPLMEVQRGPGTLPLFVDRLHGAAFYDVGTIGVGTVSPDFKHALGMEGRAQIHLNNIPTELRVGAARGTHPTQGQSQVYMRLGVAF